MQFAMCKMMQLRDGINLRFLTPCVFHRVLTASSRRHELINRVILIAPSTSRIYIGGMSKLVIKIPRHVIRCLFSLNCY